MPIVLQVFVLAIFLSVPSSLWSANHSQWEEQASCHWQKQHNPQEISWQWALLNADTLRPVFATHSCDLICPDFQVNWIVVNATCGQSDGKITVVPIGYPVGTVFNYAWSGGVSNTNVAENLPAGLYTVFIEVAQSGNGDFRNCDIKVRIPVSENGGPQFNATVKGADCITENGNAKLTISSGTPPFAINWSSGSQTANNLGTVQVGGLPAGSYSFTITDANGCRTIKPLDIPRDNSGFFDISLSAQAPSACGQSNGTITVNINGGFPPYKITMGQEIFETTSNSTFTFSGLPGGLYTVTVIDAASCEEQATISVNNPCPPSVNGWAAIDADCPDGEGFLVFNGSGSSSEYFQIRQDNSTWVIATVPGNQAVIVAVPYGGYKIKRLSTTDNCICEFPLTVAAPPPLQVIINKQSADCEPGGASAGYIRVANITGGSPPYTVLITNESGQAVADPNSLGAGTYTVKVTDGNNCEPLIATVDLTGGAVVGISVSPQDTMVCEGEPIQLDASLSPDAALGDLVVWYDANGDSIGSGLSVVVTPPLVGANTYTATIVGPCNTVSDSTTVNVLAAPAILLVPEIDKVCEGEELCILAQVIPAELAPAIIWTDLDGNLLGSGAQLCVNPAAGVQQYIATVNNGCAPFSATATITVIAATKINISPPETFGCEEQEICLIADGPAVEFILWTNLAGDSLGTGPQLCVEPLLGQSVYIASIPGLDCVEADTAYINLAENDFIITISPSPAKLCVGEEACLTALLDPASPGAEITWTDEAGNIVGTGAEFCVTPTEAGIAAYTVTADNGCATASATVEVEAIDDGTKINIEPSETTICEAQEVCLTATSPAAECIVWTNLAGDTLGIGATLCVTPEPGLAAYIASLPGLDCVEADTAYINFVPDMLSVTVSPSPAKLCVGEEACLTALLDPASPGAEITWTDEAGNIVGTGAEFCVTPTEAGIAAYTVTADNGCATASATVEVEAIDDGTKINIEPSETTICEAQEVCLTATSPAAECIVWTNLAGDTLGIGATLCVTPEPGLAAYIASLPGLDCVEADTAYINFVPDMLSVTVTPSPAKLCVGEEACLTALLDPDLSNATITWTDEAGNIVGTGAEFCVTPTEAGIAAYTVTADNGCATASATVEVEAIDDGTKINIEPSETTICEAQEVCLTATSPAAECIVWTNLDGDTLGIGATLCVTPEPGLAAYIASLPDLDCVEADTAYINFVPDMLSVTVTPSPAKLCVGEEACLTALLDPASPGAEITWTDEAGNIVGTGAEFCVTPTEAGIAAYTVTADNGCATASATVEVEAIDDGTKINIEPSETTICEAQEVCLTATSPAAECIVWTNLAGDTLGIGATLCVTPEPGLAAYIASLPGLDCVEADTAYINFVPDMLSVTVTPSPAKLCVGEEACLTALLDPDLGNATITWTDEAGNIVGTGAEFCVTPTEAGIAAYTVTADNGCATASATVEVEAIDDGTKINIEPSETTICEAQEVCLTATSPAAECIVWTNLAGDTLGIGATLCVTPEPGLAAYIASLPGLDCVEADTAYISFVPDMLSVTVTPSPAKLCVGEEACLTALLDPDLGNATITWTDEAGNIVGTGAEFCVTPTEAGIAAYTVTADNGCATASATVEVEAIDDGTKINIEPSETTICEAQEVCLTATSPAAECIVWTNLAGDTLGIGATLCVTPEPGLAAYIASLPGLDCVEADTAYINFVPDMLSVTVTPSPAKLCVGEEACLTALLDPDLGNATITWTDEAGNIVGTGAEFCVTPTEAGIAAYTVTADNGCATASATVEVEAIDDGTKINIEPSETTICEAQEVCLTATSPAAECIVWTNLAGDTLGIGATLCVTPEPGLAAYIASLPGLDCVEADTAYISFVPDMLSVTVTPSPAKLCVGEEACLTALLDPDLGNATITWTDEAGNIVGTGAEFCVTPTEAGIAAYTVTADNGCATASATVEVEAIDDGTKINIEPSETTICEAQEVCLTATSPAAECIVWTNLAGDTLGIGATLCVTPEPGLAAYIASLPGLDCVEADTAYINFVPDMLSVTVTPSPAKLCVGEEACLTALLDPDLGNATITWTDEAGNIVGTGAEFCVTPTEAGIAAYTVTADNGCATASATVEVEAIDDGTKINIEPSETTICEAQEVCLTATSPAAECIVWTNLAGDTLGIGATLCVTPEPGLAAYIASLPDLDCVEADTAYINFVPDMLSVTVTPSPAKLCVGEEACLTALLDPDLGNATITWTDEAGNIVGTGAEFCVTPTEAGIATYTVTADNGCATASATVEVEAIDDGTKINIEPSETTICEAQEVCLTATSPAAECIVWTNLAGDTLGIGATLCVTPEPGLAAYIASLPGLDCVEADTAYINFVPDMLSVTVTPSPAKLCVGEEACLTALLDPDLGNATITWTDEAGNIVGTGAEFCVTPTEAGIAAYTVTADNGCATASATVEVEAIDDGTKINIEPSETTICEAQEVCLTATSPAAECIVWTNLAGDTLGIGATLCVTPEPGLAAYIASLPGLDCVEADTAYINFVPDMLSVTVTPSPAKLCVGEEACLTALLDPDLGNATITWTDEAGNIVGTGAEFCVTPTEAGIAAYTVTADNGCATASATVEVEAIDDGTKINIEPSETTICEAQEVCLTATSPAAECIVWTNLAGDTLGIGATLCVTPEPGLAAYIASLPGLDCVEADTAYINFVPDMLSVTVTPSPAKLCVGEEACLTALLDPDLGNATITWTDEAGNIVGTGAEFCVTPTEAGIAAYTVTADNGCATASATVEVEAIDDGTKINIEPSETTICEAQEVCLTATSPAAECIVWTNLAGDTLGIGATLCVTPEPGLAAYIASLPDLDCVEADTAYINFVPDMLSVTVTPSPAKLCVGEEACLTALLDPDLGNATITWTDEAGNIVGTGAEFCVTPTEAGIAAYTVTADNGCATASATVEVEAIDDGTKINIEPSETTICEVQEVCLTATSPAAECIVWTNLAGDTLGIGATLCVTPEPGLAAYIASLPGLDCVEADTAYISFVQEELSVTVTPSPAKLCLGEEACLTAVLDPVSPGAEIIWLDESGAEVGTGLEFCVTPDAVGTFIYTVMANNGCAMASMTVEVTVVADETKDHY
jgi:hypothetical protein